MSTTGDRGLYAKYTVTNNETGEEVTDCFVLKPEKDMAARQAILTYATWVEEDNMRLALELRVWIQRIQRKELDAGALPASTP